MFTIKSTRMLALASSLFTAFAALSSAGCQRASVAATTSSASAEPPVVETVRPERGTIRRAVFLPGQVESYAQTPVFARITGYVEKFHADIGDLVAKDQVLVELSVPEMVEDLAQKQASEALADVEVEQAERALGTAERVVDRAQAVLKQTEAGLARAEASLQRWRSENDRVQKLLPARAIDHSTADLTTEQLKTAEAAVIESRAAIATAAAARDESRARRHQSETEVKVARAKFRVAESSRKLTQEMLNYSKIRAPFAGVVTRRNVDLRHLLQPPTSSAAGAPPLFLIERIDKVRVFVEVPETSAVHIAPDVVVRVRVPALREQEFLGKVARSSVALHPQGRTLRVQIDLENPDGKLRPGLYVSARIDSEQPGALTVPAGAVFVQNDQPMVVCVINGKAVRTPVKLGVRQGGKVEVIKKQVQISNVNEAIDWQDFDGAEQLISVHPENWSDGQAVRLKGRDELKVAAVDGR